MLAPVAAAAAGAGAGDGDADAEMTMTMMCTDVRPVTFDMIYVIMCRSDTFF